MPGSPKPTEERASGKSKPLSSVHSTRVLLALSLLFSVAYLVFGDRLVFGSVGTVELDAALRAALVSRYDSDSIVPLTLVEIDDATAAPPTPEAATWGFSEVTPRDKLTQMLRSIASFAPAVIVVDVDLADDKTAEAKNESSDDQELQTFLQSYSGPALVFVKRAETGVNGQVELAPSHVFDPIVAANSDLSWAHAMYATDPDGTVRKWVEWLTLCSASGVAALPSVPLRVLATWPAVGPLPFPRPAAVSFREPCQPGLNESRSHTIIYDEALSGRHEAALSRNLSRISAWQVIDPKIKRDDKALFSQRVVLIGGTRTRTTDLWHTPVGTLPGLELMANTVRFAPGQLRESGRAVVYTLVLFFLFCALQWALRPIIAIAVGAAVCAAILWLAGPYAILDATQSAIILFIELSIIRECIQLWLDMKTYGWRFVVAPHLRPHQ